VLLMFLAAGVWSRLSPSSLDWPPLLSIPNFYWQLLGVAALVAVALFCGWLQGRLGWAPAEIELEPPPADHGHDHHH
jgi:hypothetical protein